MRTGKKKQTLRAVISDAVIILLGLILIAILFQDANGFYGTDGQIRSNLVDPRSYVLTKMKAEEIYHDCEAEISRILPGFVWLGDAAAGSAGNTLPSKLSNALKRGLFSDLEDTLSLLANYYNVDSRMIPMVNMSVSREGMNEILARCGASPLLLATDYTIPRYGYMANIGLADDMGNELHFAEQSYAKFNQTTIQGVQGYLYIGLGGYDKAHPHFAFARERTGASVPVPAGTPVETESATVYTAYVPLLFFDSTLNLAEDDFVNALRKILEHQENPGGYATVIVRAEKGGKLDTALQNAFGERYIQVSKSAAELREEDVTQLAQAIYDCLDSQGAFDAVRGIVQATMEELTEISGG